MPRPKLERRELLTAEDPPAPPTQESVCEKVLRLTGVDLRLCPACGEGRMSDIAYCGQRTGAAGGPGRSGQREANLRLSGDLLPFPSARCRIGMSKVRRMLVGPRDERAE